MVGGGSGGGGGGAAVQVNLSAVGWMIARRVTARHDLQWNVRVTATRKWMPYRSPA